MKTLGIILIASILLINCSTAEEKHSTNVNLKAWSDRDLKAIQNMSPHAIMGLTLAERNEVALAAAKSLSIKEYIGVIGKNSIFKHFTKPPAQDSPEEAECRRQLGINMSAAELLRHLSEMRMIDDPAVLPYLIDALDHPARSFVGQRCFYALTYLTRQRTGDIYWARLVDDPEKHAAIRKWWVDWLDKNKDSHPVFDKNVEEKARAEVLRLSAIIEKELKPNFKELALFQSPPTLPLRWQRPLFYIEYNPGNWSLAIDTFKGIDRKRLPWLLITCRFDSQGQIDTWEQEERVQPPENLKKNITRCYVGRIEGSSLRIEVQAASPDASMIKQIQAVLKIDKDTHQLPAGDHLKAPSEPIVTEVEYRYISATDTSRGAPHSDATAKPVSMKSATPNDVQVSLSGRGWNETVLATTNEVSCGGVHWDASDGGGSEDLVVFREKDRVIVTKKTKVTTGMTNSLQGIEHEEISKTIIPLERLPFSFVIAETTVTVCRVEQKITVPPQSDGLSEVHMTAVDFENATAKFKSSPGMRSKEARMLAPMIKSGMTKAQVRDILGEPNNPKSGSLGDTWLYTVFYSQFITVTFEKDKVVKTEAVGIE